MDAAQTDRRKGKVLQCKEAKLCLAHAACSQTLGYDGTLQSDVDAIGRQLFDCAKMCWFRQNNPSTCRRRSRLDGVRGKWQSALVAREVICSTSTKPEIT